MDRIARNPDVDLAVADADVAISKVAFAGVDCPKAEREKRMAVQTTRAFEIMLPSTCRKHLRYRLRICCRHTACSCEND
jgi:hypothetical protein